MTLTAAQLDASAKKDTGQQWHLHLQQVLLINQFLTPEIVSYLSEPGLDKLIYLVYILNILVFLDTEPENGDTHESYNSWQLPDTAYTPDRVQLFPCARG